VRPSSKGAILLAVFFSVVLFSSFYGDETERTKYFELQNGLKVFLYERHTIPLLNLVFAFDVGTKNESDETSGLVHILEHYILFRGTEQRTGEEIGRDIRAHGAYFNAHTSRDLATFELSLPSEYTEFALQNQKEILFQLDITQEELDKEKQIILEELSQIQDDPIKRATSLVYQNVFQNHPYQRPVYGKREVIEGATAEKIQEFYDRYFVPANCALAVVGDFDIEEMEEWITAAFGTLENKGFTRQTFEKVMPLKKDIEIQEEMDVNIGYLVIGMIGPDYNDEDQFAMDVLTEVLGRGVIPIINYSLRGRRKLVETVSMGYGAYKYGGLITIYLTLDPKMMKAARSEVLKFLKSTRRLNYSKSDYQGEEQYYALDYLESAKNQIRFRFYQSQEKSLNVALSMAVHLILADKAERGKYLEAIEKISSSDLRRTAGDYLSRGGQVIVSIVPKKKTS
jgi:zinc protease